MKSRITTDTISVGADALVGLLSDRPALLVPSNLPVPRSYTDRSFQIKELLHRYEIRALEAILEGREKGREQGAQELHDSLGSLLSAIKIQLSVLEDKVKSPDPDHLERYQLLSGMLDNAVGEVRRMSHAMGLGSDPISGLVVSLNELSNAIRTEAGLQLELDLAGLTNRVDHRLAIMLFRVILESTGNVLEHSGARKLTIRISNDRRVLKASVEDDGDGFDLDQLAEGFGLARIRGWAAECGGALSIHSDPDLGTCIGLSVPLPT